MIKGIFSHMIISDEVVTILHSIPLLIAVV